MSSRRADNATSVEVVLLPNLKSCLLNLPASLVSLLLNSNTVAQNVVVELQWRQNAPSSADLQRGKPATTTQSVFVGWTGMQSQAKMGSLVGRDGIRGGGRQDQEMPTVEMDATFARRLGLSEGTKVGRQHPYPAYGPDAVLELYGQTY